MQHDKNKVTIIGAGFVGSTIAYSLLHQNVAEEIAIIDINQKLVEAQVMDLHDSVPLLGNTEIKVGSYDDIKNSAVVVIAGGASQKPGESRLSLVQKNSAMVKEIMPKIFKANPSVVVVMVTNPVDVLTYLAVSLYPEKKYQIMGSGTILDSMRLRFNLGKYLQLDPKSIHAYIVGEHGDSELPLWSTATVGGQDICKLTDCHPDKMEELFQTARNAAYAIIEGKQSTYYGIGAAAAYLVNVILLNKKTILPVSHIMEGEYGLKDVCLSMPVEVTEDGINKTFAVEISEAEKAALTKSAASLQETYKSIT